MDNDAVSSIYKGASSKSFTFTCSCSHSCGSSLPVLSFSEPNPVSDDISLVIICTADISKEKTATPYPPSIAIFRAIDKTKAVLPIQGRAAIIIKSEGCQPDVSVSNL